MRIALLAAACTLAACALAACCVEALAADFADIRVTGATLVSRHWGALYVLKTCDGCSEPTDEEVNGPVVQASLITVYRADADAGEITVTAQMTPGTAFRTQLGPSVQQGLWMGHPFEASSFDEAVGPPDQMLEARVTFNWTPERCEAVVPINFTPGANTGGSTLLWEDGVGVTPTIQANLVILPPQAALSLNPAAAGARPAALPLVRRESVGLNFALRGCGVHPFQQLDAVRLDGAPLLEVPYAFNAPFGPAVPAGAFATPRTQPDGAARVPPVTAGVNARAWVLNSGGCCRPSANAAFAFPEAFTPGRHRLNVAFRPVAIGRPNPLAGDAVAPADLEREFIIFGPQAALAPAALAPGQTVMVEGGGFAPSATVRAFAKVRSFSDGEREIALGDARTDFNGAFSAAFQLPPAGSDFWKDLSSWRQTPPQAQPGLLRFYIADTDFHLDYDPLEPDPQFCQVDVLPQGSATGACPIRVGLLQPVQFVQTGMAPPPAGDAPPAPVSLGPPHSTVPIEIDPDPQRAAVALDWQSADASLGFWLNLFDWDFLAERWLPLLQTPLDRAPFTFTGELGLSAFHCYAWRVYAVDWSRRRAPWYAGGDWSFFCTTHPGVYVDLGPVPADPPEGIPPPEDADVGAPSVGAAFDANGNGRLDDAEILAAVRDWIVGVPGTGAPLSDDLILQLVQAWILGAAV